MASPTVPTASQSESDVLDVRAKVWRERPLLRDIYKRYFAEMVAHFAPVQTGSKIDRQASFGTILELGGGSGNFKEYFLRNHAGQGRLIATDIVPTVHCDLAADAAALPFADGSVDNIVMQDVLHHIPYPLAFFAEASRVLRTGGRIVMTEPYISPASRMIFAVGHPEPVIPAARIFSTDSATPDPSPLSGTGAFASNQATPTLLFFRDRALFQRRFPELQIVALRRRSLFVYPLSGGFSGPKLIPYSLSAVGWAIEWMLSPLAALLACRLVVVIEKHALKS
jgi:SAM-dependent methyltransferase